MRMENVNYFPCALTIAGSDSGGGAGIQADLRTFWAFGVHGCSAITAVTAQNPFSVSHVEPLSAKSVSAQMAAVLEAYSVRAAKTGMLHNSGLVNAVADALPEDGPELVVDPVMVSTSGAALLEKDAVSCLRDRLFPRAALITPNLPEAEMLLGRKIKSLDKMAAAAAWMSREWGCDCLVKGGHLKGGSDEILDVACMGGEVFFLGSPCVKGSKASHGTGCTFSAAFAAALALGFSKRRALCEAKEFVYGSLMEEVEPGEGVHAMRPPENSYEKDVSLRKKI